jgi:hypothetical protein
MKSQHTKAHTFASRTSPNTDQSLQKSVLFSRPRRNSIFFSPSLRCFNFFATAQQPTTDEYLDRAKQDTNRQELDMDEEARTGNTGLAKVAVQCSADTFVVNQSLVLRINICGENRHLRQARKR